MVGLEAELALVRLLGAEPEEALHRRAAMRSADPVALGAPFEFAGFRRLAQRLTSAQQCFYVDAVVGMARGHVHLYVSPRR